MASSRDGETNSDAFRGSQPTEKKVEFYLASGRCLGAEHKGVAVDQLIEQQILPRLLVAHSHGSREASPKILASDAEQFVHMPLTHEFDELLVEVEAFLQRGVSVESVYLELLAPSARALGEDWKNDTCDFVDVTMGLWRLQEVMRELAARYPAHSQTGRSGRSALFTPMPGDQHSFGALMVEEIFARAGWDSEALIEPQRAEMLHFLAERSFDLVGLTVGNDCPSATLSSLVTAIRSVSKCRTVKIIVGGPAINANPGLASLIGADGTATDARSALVLADRIVMESRRIDLPQF